MLSKQIASIKKDRLGKIKQPELKNINKNYKSFGAGSDHAV